MTRMAIFQHLSGRINNSMKANWMLVERWLSWEEWNEILDTHTMYYGNYLELL